jgi:copper chaperone
MISLQIPNMTCGHCVRAVTEAVHGADPGAYVEVDLPSKKVEVQTTASREAVVARLVDAGYAPA